MKKRAQEKPRRLTLHRETVRNLEEEPQLLAQAQGGNGGCSLTTSQTGNEVSTGC